MKNRWAITLIEIIISLSLVILLCIFILNLFPYSLLAMHHSEVHLAAQKIAETTLADWEVANFQSLAVGSTTSCPAQTLNKVVFKPTLQVSAVPRYNPSTLVALRVTVTWQDQSGTKSLTQEHWVWNGN